MHQSQVILQNNLDLLRKILSELKYIRARWKSVYITYHEAGPKHHYCSTDTIINRLKTEYDKLYTSEREEFKGILEKLPTWLVEWSDQHTDKQKRMASKRLFAQEAVPYINELAISRNNQYKLLGLFFSLLDLSMDEKKFRDQYKKKHPWDHYTTPEYIAYLRDEGRNIWKNTRLCFRE